MSTSPHIEHLRTTALHLRAVARAIGNSRALTVYSLAGADTWEGPTPQACYDALVTLRRQLQTSQQAMADAAHRMERQAEALALQSPGPGRAL
jgi:hypothetical protein